MHNFFQICIIEINMIKSYDSTNPLKGYNLLTGGEGMQGVKRSPELVEASKKAASKWAQNNLEYFLLNVHKFHIPRLAHFHIQK